MRVCVDGYLVFFPLFVEGQRHCCDFAGAYFVQLVLVKLIAYRRTIPSMAYARAYECFFVLPEIPYLYIHTHNKTTTHTRTRLISMHFYSTSPKKRKAKSYYSTTHTQTQPNTRLQTKMKSPHPYRIHAEKNTRTDKRIKPMLLIHMCRIGARRGYMQNVRYIRTNPPPSATTNTHENAIICTHHDAKLSNRICITAIDKGQSLLLPPLSINRRGQCQSSKSRIATSQIAAPSRCLPFPHRYKSANRYE